MVMSNLYIPVCGFFCAVLLLISFFTKKRVKNNETTLYSGMLITSFIDSIIMIAIIFLAYKVDINSITTFLKIMNKIDYTQFVLWVWMLFLYIFHISFKDRENINEKYLKLLKITGIINIVLLIIMLILPVELYSVDNIMYSYGLSANFLYFVCCIYLLLTIIVLAMNYKKIISKKYIPFYAFVIFAIWVLALRSINPGLVVITAVIVYINLIMYFTIENPDVKMLEEVNTAKISAEKANAAKTEFLSSMSHEIRTPLNAIVGFSEAITEEDDIEKAKSDAKDIILAANNLLEIVNGILDISKIEANKMEIIEKEYNPTELFENLAKLVAPRIGDKPIDLNVNIAGDLPISLYGDSGKIKQIVTNILTNAVKYTEEGHINYNVSCVNLRNETSLVISVEDTGRGIKPEQIDKLFAKFERLEEDRNTTLEGTGLGLAITKKLVEMMGGKIVVQSVYGSGSKFTIYLKQKIDINIKDLKNIKRKQIQLQTDFTGKKVLVVDDNELNLKVDLRVLTPYNVEVTTAKSGYECIDLIFNKNEYDLILMDDMMPGMSGSETFEKLKKDSRFKTPVVVLTANAIEGMKAKYLDIGFDDYLSKPIEKPELGRVLNKFLNDSVTQTQSIIEFVEDEENQEEKIEEVKEEINTQQEETQVVEQNETTNYNTKEYLESNDIDVNHGLELLGDMDMYNSIMEDFIHEMEERLPKLEEFKNNKDMPNYAIIVHAIKSDCKYLGIMKLADQNYEHELKSKDNDIDFVEKDYNNLIDNINKYLDICKKYLNK